jgi:hypothetical protein
MSALPLRRVATGLLALSLLLGPGFGPPAPIVQAEAAQQAASQQQLADFASRIGLRDVWAFVETVSSLRTNGELPRRFVTKDAARAHGWHAGGLCDAWPGHAIGGDAFSNFGGKLPAGHQYFEADLDGDCDQRGATRLVYSADGLIFVTTDHYKNFVRVP